MGKSILQPSWVKSTKSTRFDQVRHFFEGKDVLDIGCVVGFNKPDWMHGNIQKVARSVQGIDIDRGKIDKIREAGYNVQFGDAQNFDLGKTFELVHAGELIEHLDNFNGFLTSAKKHMNADSRMLVTTPNALRVGNFIYSMTGGLKVNDEHTCWFCKTTLKTLFDRNGLEIVEMGYLKHETYSVPRKVMSKVIRSILSEDNKWNTIYVYARLKNGTN
ncbi:class I SAM-dependent methyltransferase [Fulvivirga sedimenti]|uniref:Class I SAM-dependent methyltransferase n=1 Tax=Fulvivirga sedimenti TaxID=2879465 RepID=A0A9X1HMQ3_9BACT|nr:class I SAM-dependent methyltransferase [Fulvivirga sedimenti]MCA6073422.1 class I SAM-dependent methyltransferase [Fulvivirga sedimenti]